MRDDLQPAIYSHQTTSPFRRKKCAPQLDFCQMEGARVARRRRSTLCRQAVAQYGRHISGIANVPTSNACPDSQRPSGSAEVLPVRETLGLLSRGIAACAETVAGREIQLARLVSKASRRLIQERSHISAAIKPALAAQRASWIALASWNTVGILDPIEPPNVLRTVSALPSKASETMQ